MHIIMKNRNGFDMELLDLIGLDYTPLLLQTNTNERHKATYSRVLKYESSLTRPSIYFHGQYVRDL